MDRHFAGVVGDCIVGRLQHHYRCAHFGMNITEDERNARTVEAN